MEFYRIASNHVVGDLFEIPSEDVLKQASVLASLNGAERALLHQDSNIITFTCEELYFVAF